MTIQRGRRIGCGTGRLTRTRSLPQAFTEKIEVRGANPMLVRKIVLYGILLGLVLALPGCNANWPAPGSQEEAKLLENYHPAGGHQDGE